MSRTSRFFGGLGTGYFNQAVTALVGLWLTAFLLHRLGQYEYGLWLLVGQVLGYLALLDLGVVALLPRELAYATGRAGGADRAEDLRTIVADTLRLAMWQTPLVGLAAVIVWLNLPGEWEPLRGALGVVLLAFTVTFPLRTFLETLRGLQDLAFAGAANTVAWLVGIGTAVGLVLGGFGLYGLAVGWIVTQLSLTGLAWVRLKRRFPQALPDGVPGLFAGMSLTRLQRGGWISVTQVSHVLLSGTDVIIIGALLGPAAIVPYVVTGKLINVLAHQPQMLLQAAEPGLSELKTGETRERILRVSTALTEATLIISGAFVCVVLAVNEGFVAWWVGRAQWGGLLLSVLILARVFLSHWNLTVGTALFCFGYERHLALTALGNGAVSLGAAIVLVGRYGLIGAPIGAIAGLLLVSLPVNLTALSREIRVSAWRLVGVQGRWFWRFGLAAAGAGAAAVTWTPSTIPALAAAATAIGLLYGALMLPRFTSPPLSLYAHPRLATWLARLPTPLRAGESR